MKTKLASTTLIIASSVMLSSIAFAGDRSEQNRTTRSYGGRTDVSMNAGESGITRDQVKAELAAAIRTGDIVANGERGLKLNELYPNLYPAKPVQASVTREQVKAELSAALKSGDYYLNGENGGKCNEVHPNMHTAM